MPQHDPLPQTSNHPSQSRSSEAMGRSAGIPPRLRNDGALDSPPPSLLLNRSESWVEISSQPSSSSLSSIGDEIVTTGLRVQNDPNIRRRRRAQHTPSHLQETRQASTSSQEEYDESESDEDQVMTSSNENIQPTRMSETRPEYDAESESDVDENATALGRRTDPGPVFTPQPNAFSHPPSSHRASAPNSYFPPHASNHTRPSYPPARNTRPHSYNHAADHDAALRASLTTLLSFQTAAARGLPKREERRTISNQPMGLAFVAESELMGPSPAPNSSRPLSPSTRARSSPSVSSQEAVADKGKRKAVTTKTVGEKARATKKKRVETEEGMIPPALLTWVVSAGVIVLVSVVGFGAGYVIGRETGRQEVMAGLNGSSISTGSCGREVVRGGTGTLRRFKWGLGSGTRGIVA